MYRALFFGTPAFAVPCLDALARVAEVASVVCQPDKPQGRGLTMTSPPVKARALELGIPIVQPTKLKTGDFATWVREQRVDVALVVAYGRILPSDVLAGPRLGCVNMHASLLPKYRGAAPITWAVVRGERQTGITMMQMDAGMDTGDILEQRAIPIGENETAGELSVRLAGLAAEMVAHGLSTHVAGGYTSRKQDEKGATLAPILKKDDGRVSFDRPPRGVHDHVRGMTPWPGAFVAHRAKTVRLVETRVSGVSCSAPPGTVLLADKTGVIVACREGAVELVRVQPEGKKAMRAAEWVMGRGVAEGDVLT